MNNAIRHPAPTLTIPEVKIPVRSSLRSSPSPPPFDGAFSCSSRRFPIPSRIRIVVSSLCSTFPWAACRISSSYAASIRPAASFTISHCVVAGSGSPRFFCKRSSRWNGNPLPYLSTAIMAAEVASYFSGPTPGGGRAVKTSPQRLQRSFSKW